MDTNVAADMMPNALSFEHFRAEVLSDYQVACLSREASLMGRREVLTGKAKFGIFGDGKELPQIAWAKFFRPGDWRSGYYRDQTWMFALGKATVKQFFAQLYANPHLENDPWSAGRQMNAHFTSRNVDELGEMANLAGSYNTATDMAPTAGQMPRALGLALASKLFRESDVLKHLEGLSNRGNEVCFCSIGDASTSEGHFWETMNAAAVMQVPLAVFVWDDGYGISVPREYQTTKGSISEALAGFAKEDGTNGIDIYKVKAWDYAGLCEVFERGIERIRQTHIPALFHVEEVTQPQGHSTSGSHERYKSPERLAWEREWDCNKKFKEWILANDLATEEELEDLEAKAKHEVREGRQQAWDTYEAPMKKLSVSVGGAIEVAVASGADAEGRIAGVLTALQGKREPMRRDLMHALGAAIDYAGGHAAAGELERLYLKLKEENSELYNSHLYYQGPKSALQVPEVKAEIDDHSPLINGYEVLNNYFDTLFAHNPRVVAFGEDLGKIGDVNQGFAGLQAKFGDKRIFDTGIREASIMGQGIGLALRGLRPIAEIQYLDYLVYGLQPLTDDVASLQYRTVGQQVCPIVVRTRGHRLEGIWHSGSPMGLILSSLRGMYVCVPRNMVQAAGMYNTLMRSNDPAIVIECLNGYRLKERKPANLLDFTVPLGVPEILREGTDITIVSYGSTLRVVQEACLRLEEIGISAEVVDVQTLLPFDRPQVILESLKKTNRILFVDEDVPGGAAAYMYNMVLEQQGGYRWLDSAPRTLTAHAHRPAYGSDGDYFSKPNTEDVVRMVKSIMAE
jgi:pyruvate/2-oxoglutarate/acetoin dehydrogenase E1 component/TPP-dependent pyruvate/acetoin dehydrogenase alpha subunit